MSEFPKMKFPGWNILMKRGKTQILNRFETDLKAYLKIRHCTFFIHMLTKLRAYHPVLNESLLEVLV